MALLIALISCSMEKGPEVLNESYLLEERLELKISELKSKSATDLGVLLDLGVLYHANDRFDDAKAIYGSLLDQAPQQELKSRVIFYLALIDLEDGKAEEAENRLVEAVDLYPEAKPALYRLAELSFNRGETDVALGFFSKMIEIDHADAYALLGRARSFLTIDKRQEALADLLRMREENPEFKGGLGLLAQILEENGEHEKASLVRREIVRGAIPPYPHEWLMRLRKSSYDTKELGIYYEDYANAGQASVAVWFLNRIEELNPNDWNAKVLRGLKYAKEGKTEMALAQYEEALRNGAEKSFVYPLIVKCMLLLGNANEAASFGEEGLREVPDSVDLLVEMAGVTMVQFKFDRAADYFDRALELNPYHEKALQYYAAMLKNQGKPSAANELLERWIQISPADPAPYLELAFLQLKTGESGRVVQEIEKLYRLEWSERSIERLRELASVLRDRNKRASLECYQILNEIRPADEEALVARIELLVQLKQVEKAMGLVNALVRLQPNNLAVRIAAGDIYGMNGEVKQAEVEWRAALDLAEEEGNETVRRQILSRLRSL